MSYEDEVLADSPTGAWMLQGNANALAGSNGSPSNVTFGSDNGPAPELPDAAVFNGSNSDIALGNQSPNTGPGQAWTYEAWVWLDAVSTTRYRILAQDTEGTSQAPRLAYLDTNMSAGQLGVEYRQDSGSNRISIVISASAETWYHLVAVHTGSQLQLYVNGSLVNTANDSQCHQQTNNLHIGTSAGNFPLAGRVAGVAVYASALSPGRVEAHFDAAFVSGGSGSGTVSATGLVAGDGNSPPTEDPPNLFVTVDGSTGQLTWDASPTPGVVDYQVFRRSPQTGESFDPTVDTPVATGIEQTSYDDEDLDDGDYDWQVFGRIPG